MQTQSPSELFEGVLDVRKDLAERFPDGAVYLVSKYNRLKRTQPGRITVASLHVAALMIFQETHQLATKAQILNWAEEQLEIGKKLKEQQAKKDTKVNIDLGGLVRELRLQIASESVEAPKGKPKEAAQTAA